MPSRFKVKLKLELEIEGTRDDVPLITEAVGQQVAGMLSPTSSIVEGEITEVHDEPKAQPATMPSPAKKSRTRKTRQSQPIEQNETTFPEWIHDPSKWGTPKQEWNAATKSLWLLYVISKETGIKELTPAQIESNFNAKFQDAKMIHSNNISRDLGKLAKSPSNPPVGKNGKAWYMTQSGEKQALSLIAEALDQTTASDSGATP
jgi:hypothetical protein